MRRGFRLAIAGFLAAVLLAGPGRCPGQAARPPSEPEAPQPTAAVRPLLDAAREAAARQQWAASLEGMERALAAARGAGDAAGEARAQRGRAAALSNLIRPEAAGEACRAAAAAWERAGDGPGQVEALLVAALEWMGTRPPESRQLLDQALTVAHAEKKRPHAMAATLDSLAHAMDQLDLPEPARACWEAALALQEKAAPDTLAEARTLSDLGAEVMRLGDLEKARAYLERAVALQETLAPGSLELAGTLHNLSLVAQRQRDLAAAQRYLERALALDEKLSPDAPETLQTLLDLGDLTYDRADLRLARQLFQRALARAQKRTPRSPGVAECLKRLGVVAYRQGDSAEARELFQRALALREQLPPNPRARADLLDNLGLVATQQNDLEAAAEYHRQALAIYEQVAPGSLDLAFCLNNLGNVAHLQGDRRSARNYYERALALKERLMPRSLEVASTLSNLANVSFDQGDLAAAEADHRRALALREALAPESLAVASSLYNLGAIERARRHLAAAAADFRHAAAIEERLAPGSLALAYSLASLAGLAADRRDWPAAEPLALRAWSIVRRQAAGVIGDEARQAFGAGHGAYAAVLARIQLARGETAAAFQTLEEGRGQALLQILSERGLDTHEAPASLRADYHVAWAAQDEAERASSEASTNAARAQEALAAAQEGRAAPETLARLQGDLLKARQRSAETRSAATRARLQVDALWAEIKRRSPRTFVPSLTVRQAAKVLPRGTLYLGYAVESETPVVFLLRAGPKGQPVLAAYPLSLSLAALQQRIEAFLEVATEPLAGIEATARAGRSLFGALVPAAARPRVLAAKRLLISPDGPLWGVPFPALVVNGSGPHRYLSDDHPISLTQSVTLFAQARSGRSAPASRRAAGILVVGNPVFDDPQIPRAASVPQAEPRVSPERTPLKPAASPSETPSTHLAVPPAGEAGGARRLFWHGARPPMPLPATAEEARQIARLYGAAPLLGQEATELAVRRAIGEARVVHLATHAIFLPRQAMSSGLLLSVPGRGATPRSDDDGVLQAWEIYSQLRLQAALVVLSACDTGRGENVPSEGIVGLTRALQYAGARSIVASQWAVPDESTARLMVAFHQRLRQGVARDEALRQAMALTRRDPRTVHPHYWAPFFLIGDPAGLSMPRH